MTLDLRLDRLEQRLARLERMQGMTPIKYIGWYGCMVFCVDHADQVELKCVAVDERAAEWIAWSLGRAHGTDHKKVDSLPVMRY